MANWYRSYVFRGTEGEAKFEADSEEDAESESYHWEQGFLQGKNHDEFEWTSSPYDFQTMIDSNKQTDNKERQ